MRVAQTSPSVMPGGGRLTPASWPRYCELRCAPSALLTAWARAGLGRDARPVPCANWSPPNSNGEPRLPWAHVLCRLLAKSSETKNTWRMRFLSFRGTFQSAAWLALASFARPTRSWSTCPCSSAPGPVCTHAPRASGTGSWMRAAPFGGRAAACTASSPFSAFPFEPLGGSMGQARPAGPSARRIVAYV